MKMNQIILLLLLSICALPSTYAGSYGQNNDDASQMNSDDDDNRSNNQNMNSNEQQGRATGQYYENKYRGNND